MSNTARSKSLDHLGLVSGMFDFLEIGTEIDCLLNGDSDKRGLSLGLLTKALVVNGLGFTQRTLYMVSSFFEGKPIELLLGQGVTADQLNDNALGRALDAIHAYGTTALFSQLTPLICKKLDLKSNFAHMDSTDFHLDGHYNDENPPDSDSIIHLTKGYSRDHRPDLNQVVLNMITENQAGIPIHMEALSGNSSDKTVFKATIEEHIAQLHSDIGTNYIVGDSALYTEKTITINHDKSIKWITRVPESIGICKQLVGSAHDFKPLVENYEYKAFTQQWAGIEQRWLLVYSQEAYKREYKTLVKAYNKKSLQEYKTSIQLTHQHFNCEKDAENAFQKFINTSHYISISELSIEKKQQYKGKGRPKKGAKPIGWKYSIRAQVSCQLDWFAQKAHYKGRFVIATNQLDCRELSDKELFDAYKGQSKVERGFRFLKDPQFIGSSMFVKKPERVEALLFIMTLCLTIYAALEYTIRKELNQKKQTIANQIGKQVKNPTARWIFQIFTGIHVLYLEKQKLILNRVYDKLHISLN